MPEAARLTDPICHTSALTGFLVGAVIGIALIAAVAFATFTCGFGVALLAGMAAGIGASGILSAGEAIGRMFTTRTGQILTGSPNVFTNKLNAAYAKLSTVQCGNHNAAPLVAEGSSNVFINGQGAARKEDKITCGAKIDGGSSNVRIGGETVRYLPVEDEVPGWLRTAVDWAFALAGLVGGLAGLARQLAKQGMKLSLRSFTPCAAKFIGGFVLGEVAGRYIIGPTIERTVGGLLGHPVDVTSGRKLLLAHDEVDFSLPAHIPLECRRFYASDLDHVGALGRGWLLPWDPRLEARGERLHYFDLQGREMVFPRVEPGHAVHSEAEQRTLSCTRDGRYVLHTIDETYYEFGPLPADGVAWLRRMEDQRGQWHAFERNGDGRLEAIRTSSGQHLRLDYAHPLGRLTSIEVVEGGTPGALVRYGYDDRGQLTRVTDAQGRVTRTFAYADGRMISHRDIRGFECHYRWAEIDGQARVVEHGTGTGERYLLQYDVTQRITTATDELGRQARWQYDEHRHIVDSTDFDGSRYRIEYNEAGHPVALHLPGDRSIRLERDGLGRIVKEADPLGRVTTTTYHANSLRVMERVLPGGAVYRADYDPRGLMLSSTDPLGRVERYEYDQAGLPQTHVDARGGIKRMWWNRRGQLVAYTDCSDKTTHYRYDADGNPAAVIDASGRRTEFQVTRSGDVQAVVLPDGSRETYEYDGAGQVSRHVDAFGRERGWQYSPRGQIVASLDPAQRTLRYDYDPRGRLIALTNANGAQYRFEYDRADRLAREIRPDGTERHLRYDAAGDLAGIVTLGTPGKHDAWPRPVPITGEVPAPAPAMPERARREVRFERDAIGRLTVRHTYTAVTAYAWNDSDQLVEANVSPTEAGAALGLKADRVAFDYDVAGRLVAEHGAHGSVRYGLDSLDNLAALTLPQGQRIDTLMYGSGHVHQIRLGDKIVSDFERDDLHREILRSQGRLSQRCGYDALGRKTWQSADFDAEALTAGQGKLWRRYGFDPHGELGEQQDSLRGTTRYEYDPAGRLQQRTDRQTQEQFAWDAAGNLLDDIARKSRGRLEDNRLKVWQDIRFDYDPFGNVVEKKKGARQVQRFRFDADDRLIEVVTENAHGRIETRFAYDALGRRIERSETIHEPSRLQPQTERKRFVWQGLRLLQELRETGVSNYLYSPDDAYAPLARIDQALSEDKSQAQGAGAIYHFHTDLVGAPLEVTDEAGELAWAGRYQAWGKVMRNEDPALSPKIEQPLRFPGQYADESTGLHYNTFRYYDPDVGRFVSPDPIGLIGGENLYAYAPNPTGWSDPLGWMPWAWNGDTGMGHHLVPRGKANSVGLDLLGTERHTPTFFPEPYDAGMHESIHQAQRPHIGKIQGPWTGTADELLAASRRGLADLPDMRGSLKIPATGEILASGVTPTEAFDRLTEWHNTKLQERAASNTGC